MKALIISADNFEDSELLVPYYRLKEEGIEVDVASMKAGSITGKHGYAIEVTKVLKDVNARAYDILILPGGRAPEAVRKEKKALDLARCFFEKNRPVAAICHGGETLISAGVVKGRRVTCYKSVVPEMKAAGAIYEDAEVVVDNNLISSRQPSDLPAFMREIMKKLKGKKT